MMPENVNFTEHAMIKLDALINQGFAITEESVINALTHPQHVVRGHSGRLIAETPISSSLILRVVYEQTGSAITIVTFYPARRTRYGNHHI